MSRTRLKQPIVSLEFPLSSGVGDLPHAAVRGALCMNRARRNALYVNSIVQGTQKSATLAQPLEIGSGVRKDEQDDQQGAQSLGMGIP